jgi:predicted PurR-regulated permease PerM
MSDPKPDRVFAVVSPREARLLFWLVLIALLTVIANLSAGVVSTLSGPAVILFVAWLMAYVLEPFVDWLARHMPFKSRGLAVAVTYVTTIVVAFAVLLAAGVTLIQAAISFAENLPAIVAQVRELLTPLAESLGLSAPSFDLPTIVSEFVARNGQAIADAAKNATVNMIALVAGAFTAVIISVGLAAGQVTLFGWLRRFLPERTYDDLAALERAIAVSFGGFVRGRGLIGVIYGAMVLVVALIFRVPYAPLIAVIAGMIVFIPWIGPLIGWAVLPAFAAVSVPEAVVPCLILSLIGAIGIQLVVTQFVMGAAVNMSPVAVFAVVILGTAVAGIAGAIFAIPTAAAILAITDYLRQRDVLLRAADPPAIGPASAPAADLPAPVVSMPPDLPAPAAALPPDPPAAPA